jgi:hypothetical protein
MADFLRICGPIRLRFRVNAWLAGERTPFKLQVLLTQLGNHSDYGYNLWKTLMISDMEPVLLLPSPVEFSE